MGDASGEEQGTMSWGDGETGADIACSAALQAMSDEVEEGGLGGEGDGGKGLGGQNMLRPWGDTGC